MRISKNSLLSSGFSLALLLTLFSCDVETETLESTEETPLLPVVEPPKPKKIDPVKFTSYLERKYMPQAKLFGMFFQERMQFNIVDEPDLTLYKQSVSELTFYHIDEELCKKKFLMDGDISESLIYTLGNFKLRPLDSITTTLAKAGPILIREGGRRYLNSALRNFELKWEKEDRLIRYLTESDSLGNKSFTYSEEDPDYRFLLKALKYGIQIQEGEAEIIEEVL